MTIIRLAAPLALSLLLVTPASGQAIERSAPVATPLPPAIPPARDVPFPGSMTLDIDATDLARGVYRVTQIIPVPPGANELVLLLPEWLPGKHSPRGQLNLLADLHFEVDGVPAQWTRDPVEVYAFRVPVPAGARQVTARFVHTSPLQTSEGRITMTREMLNLQWEAMSLYPAGHYVRQIAVTPTVTFPEGWQVFTALDGQSRAGDRVTWATVDYETLVDSPVFAGAHAKVWDLGHAVKLDVVADEPRLLDAKPEHIAAYEKLVDEALELFGSRPFDHYDFLLALTDRLGGIGLEHHRSSENSVAPEYFTNWSGLNGDRSLLPHEYTHTWSGKYRRPADQMTLNFEEPLQDSLLWVYEGADMYFGTVLHGRAGFNTLEEMRDDLAMTAALYDNRVGREWRPLQDTTNDPIVASRTPQPWRSWSRSEDYYSEGLLIWLDADMLIREQTRGRKSLDDFARAFFGMDDGVWSPRPFTFNEVVEALNGVHEHDWAGFLRTRLDRTGGGAPLDGLERAGWRLVYSDERTDYQKALDGEYRRTDLSYSLGVMTGSSNQITAVQWGSPAFDADLTVGTTILAVNGQAASGDALARAVTAARDSDQPIELITRHGDHYRTVQIPYYGGLRYPRLERIEGTPDRLARIFAPRTR